MAMTVTDLAAALRLGDGVNAPDAPIRDILTRLMSVGTARAEKYAPEAPDDVTDEAVIRFCAYLFDQPTSAAGIGYSAAWRNSGAASLLSPWKVRRLGRESDE